MQRTDIRQSDVFISWTGKDRELKDRIISYLRQNNIFCTESDHDCAGDFRQWSREVVGKSTVFLLLYTENTVNSEFVPVEIEEFRKLDDYRNRCVPVVTDYSLYEKNLPDLAESESAVMFDGHELAEEHLEKILYNVQTLINNRLCNVYREATKPTYLRLVSMLKAMRVADREFDHNRLYIDRTVTDENGEEFASAAGFTNTEDIIFLQGPAGSGKSCYIDQLRNASDDQTLVMSLSCRKLVDATDLFSVMFEEFKRYCGNRQFYTSENFKSLLSVRHLLLVLDGMDEIATEKGTRKFLNIIKDYYDVNSDSTTLFFTSRNESDADLIAMNGQTPRKLILRSLDEDQIKVFGSNLFLMLGSSDKSDDFYVRVQELADEIRTNPLLLSQLAIVYDKKNEIPQTTVGIYDAVCEITMSREDDIADVPDEYREMVTRRLSDILKSFSAERYRLLSLGKQIDTVKIMTVILKNDYTDARDRAAFLEEYLQNRAMLVDGEFYHKMLLEYFTATYYYEQCFDDYDEIENVDNIKNLFEHYGDPYWSAVLQMFLVKADSLIDSKTTTELYRELMTYGITEYTLLFDTCRDLIRYKKEAQSVLIYDILQKSANGIYPPYGPLFWYVPEYKLYEDLLITLDSVKESDFFTKALALTRDVCWIFGHYNTVDEITDRVNGKVLFEKTSLSGVRRGLCELFFTGNTESTLGDDIYPRCFNTAEAKSFMKNGCGVIGRMSTPFADELDLFSHTSYNELNDEFIGLISCPYIIDEIENELAKHSCRKLNGLILSPSDNTKMEYIAFNRRHINVMYIPENITEFVLKKAYDTAVWNTNMPLSLCVAVFGDEFLYVTTTNVSLPDGIKEIPPKAFYNCSSLKSVCIPSSVVSIGENAFGDCNSMTSINIPDSVTSIGLSAFSGCRSLTSIIIPDSVTKIGDYSFGGCSSLVSVKFPDNITRIGEWMFYGCASLTSIVIPNGVTEIGSESFRECCSLTSINIPDSVTKIGISAFEDCSSLISVDTPKKITESNIAAYDSDRTFISHFLNSVGGSAFKNCSSLTSFNIPNNITSIDAEAFSGCGSLTSVNIPDHVHSIYWKAFENCSSLISIKIPYGVTQISSYLFENCSSLSSVDIPNSIKNINNHAFKGCSSLTSINIPESVTEIMKCAFSDCCSLTSINIPDSVTEIGDSAFEGCSGLLSIKISIKFKDDIERVFGNINPDIITFRPIFSLLKETNENENVIVVPEGTTEIEDGAFQNSQSLTSIIIPESVTKIGDFAFYGCRFLKFVDIPDSVTEIGDFAFDSCKSLTSIVIPNGVTEIGSDLFRECCSLTSINIPDDVTEIGSGAFESCSSLTSVNVPDSVTKIGSRTFCDCESLTSVIIPNSVTEIGDDTFSGCCSLMEINIPDNVTKIGERVFRKCSSLKSVIIPAGVTRIGNSAFSGCSLIKSVNIPERVIEIGDFAFKDCILLSTVNIPDGVTKIGEGTFLKCNSLMSIKIPDGITQIGVGAFYNCSSLKSVNIPDGATEINWGAFQNCTSLNSIKIPSSVRIIGDDAFGGCTGLREITISRRFEDDLPRIFSGVDLSQVKINWL